VGTRANLPDEEHLCLDSCHCSQQLYSNDIHIQLKTVFWDQTLHSLEDRHQLFWENCHHHLYSTKSEEGALNIKAYVCTDDTASLSWDCHLETHNWTSFCIHFLYLVHTLPLFHTTVKEFNGFVFCCYINHHDIMNTLYTACYHFFNIKCPYLPCFSTCSSNMHTRIHNYSCRKHVQPWMVV
jgi:hypothetical protein